MKPRRSGTIALTRDAMAHGAKLDKHKLRRFRGIELRDGKAYRDKGEQQLLTNKLQFRFSSADLLLQLPAVCQRSVTIEQNGKFGYSISNRDNGWRRTAGVVKPQL